MANFGDENNWQLIYDAISYAQGVSGSLIFVPIAPITLPFSLQYPFLRVTANYIDARSTWRLGAWVNLLVDELAPEVELARVLAPVNKPIIIPKPSYVSSYKVRIEIPKYFSEISLQIDGYKGPIDTSNQTYILGL